MCKLTIPLDEIVKKSVANMLAFENHFAFYGIGTCRAARVWSHRF